MPLWGGRFSKNLDKTTNDFNSSFPFDARLIHDDLEGSLAHTEMLRAQKIINNQDAKKIRQGLLAIQAKIQHLDSPSVYDLIKIFDLDSENLPEDVHTFVEQESTKNIGDAGKRLHTARSRNDQVALDLRLYARRQITEIMDDLKSLILTAIKLAEDNIDNIMPGFTHLQHAQPITFAHHLSAYLEMFDRDMTRLKNTKKSINRMPLGSGALAGTTYPIDRKKVAELLEFDDITRNTLDSVSDRDFVIDFLENLSLIMLHLSRLSEELVLFSSQEYSFIELDDAFSTGSSIMPQKKNPDIPELIRGKTGRVYGDLVALLTTMKGLPLAYDKDLQEDKEALFDAIDTVKSCLITITPMLKTITVNRSVMFTAAKKGYLNATDLADYLVKKGLPFREAHKISGALVQEAIKAHEPLDNLDLETYQKYSPLFKSDLYRAIDLRTCVKNRCTPGGPSPLVMRPYLTKLKKKYA